MPRWVRYSLFPAAIAFAALFAVLPQTGADKTIKIVGKEGSLRFQPAIASVEPGARVAFENDTRLTETATCLTCTGKAWDTGDIQPGQTIFLTIPTTAGDYQYGSVYDQGLIGRLLVGVGAEASPSPSAS
jgi:plastocyanin